MSDAVGFAIKAEECYGAAQMLRDKFPMQSMFMLALAVETAIRAACRLDGTEFDPGEDVGMMMRFVPDDAWSRVSRAKITRLMESCEAWVTSGRTDGDFLVALDFDMEIAGEFIEDVMGLSSRDPRFSAVA